MPWPTGGEELPNDDVASNDPTIIPNGETDDEDCKPNDEDDRLFPYDVPGRFGPPSPTDIRNESRWNFNEFCRVRLDGTWPTGDHVDGSRCSGKLKWHSVLDIAPVRNAAGEVTEFWRKTELADFPNRMLNAISIGIHLDQTVIDVLKPSGN